MGSMKYIFSKLKENEIQKIYVVEPVDWVLKD
jgi:hypothetical protein